MINACRAGRAAMTDANSLIPQLLARTRKVLKLGNGHLGTLVGVGKRLASQWESGRSQPDAEHLHHIARLVYPDDRQLAIELAEAGATTVVALGLEPAPDPPPWRLGLDGRVYPRRSGSEPPPGPDAPPRRAATPTAEQTGSSLQVRHLVDSVVCAAAEAGTSTPQAVRPILAAAIQRAAELRLSLADLALVLGAPDAPTSSS
jgi:transcriptional regulator with XRE-family HTH domain